MNIFHTNINFISEGVGCMCAPQEMKIYNFCSNEKNEKKRHTVIDQVCVTMIGEWYALLMRANKPETIVQSSKPFSPGTTWIIHYNYNLPILPLMR